MQVSSCISFFSKAEINKFNKQEAHAVIEL